MRETFGDDVRWYDVDDPYGEPYVDEESEELSESEEDCPERWRVHTSLSIQGRPYVSDSAPTLTLHLSVSRHCRALQSIAASPS